MELELVKTMTRYHVDMSRRVWESINQITEEQFVTDDAYSRGSIRNLMVHLASTDRRWLAELKNLPDIAHLNLEDYQTKAAERDIFESALNDLAAYVDTISAEELAQNANGIPNPRWAILIHLINHGTDHRATVLQRLHEFGAPTFDQDFIMWLWNQK